MRADDSKNVTFLKGKISGARYLDVHACDAGKQYAEFFRNIELLHGFADCRLVDDDDPCCLRELRGARLRRDFLTELGNRFRKKTTGARTSSSSPS